MYNMKIINIDVVDKINIKNIEDTDSKSIKFLDSVLSIPADNYNNILLNFDFISPDATKDGLHLFAIFSADFLDKPIEVEITELDVDGKYYKTACFIPFETLDKTGYISLGIYGYILNNDGSLNKRVSLTPIIYSVNTGSYREDAEEGIIPTPTVFEVYFDKVANMANVYASKNELNRVTTSLQNNIDIEANTRENSDSNLQSQINSLASGSPLVASSISEMTDTSRVYVNTSDGNWYYYNGTSWVNGGVYQSKELADLSITGYKIKNNTIGYDKLNLVHENPVYIKEPLKFKKSTMHLYVPDLFVNINGTWKTIKATDFPNDYPTGEFRFWIDDLTTIYCDTQAIANNQNPFIKKTKAETIKQVGDRYRIIAVVRDNHVLSDYTVKYLEDEDIIDIRNQIADMEKKFDVNKCKLMIPDKLFVIDDITFPLYKNSMVSDLDESKKVLMTFKSEKGYHDAYYEYIEPKLTVDASKIGTDCFIGVIPNKLTWETGVYGKNVTIVSKSLSNVTNKNPKLLFFGDSLTVKGTPSKTKDYLTDFGINATMLGTVKDDYATACEGRGNRTLAQYIGYRSLETTDDTTPTPVYPFLKVATNEDKTNHPDWCFTRTGSIHEQNYNEATDKNQTFYIFDFAYYLSSKGYSNPDVVIISMSTNDFWKYEPEDATNICKLAYDIMINQILTACPNCKIGIIPNTSYGNTRGNKDVVANWNTTAQDYIREMNKSNVDVIGAWASQSTDMAFVFAKVNKVGTGNIYNYQQQDNIHPSVWGIKETSKIIASYIVNQL